MGSEIASRRNASECGRYAAVRKSSERAVSAACTWLISRALVSRLPFVDVQGEQVAALNERGLHCERLTGDFVVRCFATADPSRSPQADVVLLCAPSYATAQAARAAEIILKPDAYCLTIFGIGRGIVCDGIGDVRRWRTNGGNLNKRQACHDLCRRV
jgi:hypothetical protein